MIDDFFIESITKVANKICKKKGYVVTLKQWQTEVILEAVLLIHQEIEKAKDEDPARPNG